MLQGPIIRDHYYCCVAGPQLPADTPFSIVTSTGNFVRNDNSTAFGYGSNGTGITEPEQYTAYDPDNPAGTDPIKTGDTTILKNVETGQYCRLAPLPTNSTQLGMICDQANASTATVFTYTGYGLAYNGIPMVSTGPGEPLLLGNTTSLPIDANDDQLGFPLAGEIC